MSEKERTPFQAALEYFLHKKGHGAQSWLAKKAGKTQPAISAMLTRDRAGRTETMNAIAMALGYDLVEFLDFGRTLLLNPDAKPEKKKILSLNPVILKIAATLETFDDKELELISEFVEFIKFKKRSGTDS